MSLTRKDRASAGQAEELMRLLEEIERLGVAEKGADERAAGPGEDAPASRAMEESPEAHTAAPSSIPERTVVEVPALAGPDDDEAFDDVESLNAVTPSIAPPESAAPKPPTAPLHAVASPREDQEAEPNAGASDDELICGDFDSVDEVLGGVFGEQAAVVDESAQRAGLMQWDEPECADEPAAGADVHDDGDIEPALVEEAPAPVAANAAPAAPAPQVPRAVAADPPVHAAQEEPNDAEPEAAPVRRSPVQRVIGAIMAALTLLNSPLRHLPPRARTIIDWLALTLVFWVPVVWVIVLLR